MSKKNQNYTNRKQNRFQPERMRGNVFVNNSGKQWLPGENGRAAKVERLLKGAKEEKTTACTHLLLIQPTHAVANPVPKELDLMQSTFFT